MDVNQIVETLKHSFLSSFRTGNVVIDTIMTGVIVCFTTYLMSSVRYVHYVNIKERLLSWFGPKKPTENKIIVSGKKIQGTEKTRVEYSTTFCAVVHQIKKLDCAQANISELSEIEIGGYAGYSDYRTMKMMMMQYKEDEDNEQKDAEVSLIVTQDKPFKLVDDVYGIVKINQVSDEAKAGLFYESKEGKNGLKSQEFQIVIKSSVLSMDSLRTLVNDWIHEYQQSMKMRENKIIVSGTRMQSSYKTRLDCTPTFYAVLHQIKQLDCGKANITELREINIENYDEHARRKEELSYHLDKRGKKEESDDDDEKKDACPEANLIVSQNKPFKLADDVYAIVIIDKGSNENKNENKMCETSEEIKIIIKSSVFSMNSLRLLVNGWIQEYQKSLAPNEYLRYFCYTPNEENSNSAKNNVRDFVFDGPKSLATKNYTEFRFDSGKNFDNVFFPEKDDMVEMIDFFTNNKDWYKTRGIPYTMGFLLHGEPGCGKTSTIKAIANHTRRHIVSVPLDKIKTPKELLSVFNNARINGKDIPLNRRLYVLEDIDAGELKDVVADRASKGKQNGDSDKIIEVEGTDDQLTLLNLLKIPNVKIFDPKKHRLTLAVLLEVLDGVMEMDGRMLVITTNYPERLDKALIRPGRIDMKLQFGRCTRDCLVAMYQHFFQTNIPKSLDKDSLPHKKWTPAETIRVFLYHMRDPPQALQYLITANKEEGSDIGALALYREKSKVRPRQKDKEGEEGDITNTKHEEGDIATGKFVPMMSEMSRHLAAEDREGLLKQPKLSVGSKVQTDEEEEQIDDDIVNTKDDDRKVKEAELYEYVHRIGGRAGNVSIATSFSDAEKNSGIAGPLVKILTECEQMVPDWLAEAATNVSAHGDDAGADGDCDEDLVVWFDNL